MEFSLLLYKTRDDAYLMSWVEDACNGMQGFCPQSNLMHDAGFGFGMSNFEGEDALSVTTVGAYARPLAGFDILKYFENKRK